jgi:hypothetical protein
VKKIFLLLMGCIIFTSCTITPKNPDSWMEMKKNACLPTAISFRESLRKYDIWAEVVTYYWIDNKTQKPKGHAIVAYMYPAGKNQLWTYDSWGSYRVRAYKDNPLQISKEAVRVRYEDRDVYSAQFIK